MCWPCVCGRCTSVAALSNGYQCQQTRAAVNGLVSMSLYDETTYYNAVKNRWFGLGDYATDQPGR